MCECVREREVCVRVCVCGKHNIFTIHHSSLVESVHDFCRARAVCVIESVGVGCQGQSVGVNLWNSLQLTLDAAYSIHCHVVLNNIIMSIAKVKSVKQYMERKRRRTSNSSMYNSENILCGFTNIRISACSFR